MFECSHKNIFILHPRNQKKNTRTCVGAVVYGTSVLPTPFCCELKAALKSNIYLQKAGGRGALKPTQPLNVMEDPGLDPDTERLVGKTGEI